MCKVLFIFVSEDRCMHEYVRAGCRLVDCPKEFVTLWLTNNKKPCYACEHAVSCRVVVK